MNAMPEILNGQPLPNGWKVISVKWLSRRYSGGTPDKNVSYYWNDGTIPWLNSGSVNQGVIRTPSEFITEDGFANSSAKWIPRGSLVMALAGQGKTKAMVGYLDIETTGNQSLAAIVPTAINGKFLYWWLTRQYRHIRNLSSQDGRDGLNLEMVGSIRCPVPPIDVQRRVAAFLDEKTAQIDGLIARKQALLSRLAEKRQAIITQSVTKGLNPAAPMKDSGIEWLGQIPAHWEVKRLKFLGQTRYGLGEPPERDDEGIPFIRATDIYRGKVDLSAVQRVSRDAIPWRRRPQLHAGEVLVVRSGAYTGDSALVTDELAGLIAGYDMVYTPTKINSQFIAFTLLAKFMVEGQMFIAKQRAAQPHLNAEELGDFLVALPSDVEQAQIAQYLEASRDGLEFASAQVALSVERLTEYRSALITSAVTGQIEGLR